ncbi:MAG: hypothetical protein GXZ15_03445 [Campylobacter sp.]|nr:hypothetical protein [Campylobacter sp.]
MKIENVYVCNVCSLESGDDKDAVFITAHKGTEEIHICTACIPAVIHGSGIVVRPNKDVEAEILGLI